jgi:hypothetical protein
MNFLRKTLLTTNNLNTTDSDVELEDLESGGRTASLPPQPPTDTLAVTNHTFHPLAGPSSAPSLSITRGRSQALAPLSSLPNQSAPSPFSFHVPQTVISTITPGQNQPGPSSDTPSFHLSPPQMAISTITLQASRKRAHQIADSEHNNRVRIIELGPTIESTKVVPTLILDFFITNQLYSN